MNELIFVSIVALIAVSLGVWAIAARRAHARRYAESSVALMCPGTGREAVILALKERSSGRFTRILRCSELPRGKRCRETCLRLANCERLTEPEHR